VKDFLRIIDPRLQRIVKHYREDAPISLKYNLEDQIEQIFQKRIPLKSGGYLLIDPTEALVAVDVNSGRANGDGAVEEMVFKVNMEAASEISPTTSPAGLGRARGHRFHRHARIVATRVKWNASSRKR